MMADNIAANSRLRAAVAAVAAAARAA